VKALMNSFARVSRPFVATMYAEESARAHRAALQKQIDELDLTIAAEEAMLVEDIVNDTRLVDALTEMVDNIGGLPGFPKKTKAAPTPAPAPAPAPTTTSAPEPVVGKGKAKAKAVVVEAVTPVKTSSKRKKPSASANKDDDEGAGSGSAPVPVAKAITFAVEDVPDSQDATPEALVEMAARRIVKAGKPGRSKIPRLAPEHACYDPSPKDPKTRGRAAKRKSLTSIAEAVEAASELHDEAVASADASPKKKKKAAVALTSEEKKAKRKVYDQARRAMIKAKAATLAAANTRK